MSLVAMRPGECWIMDDGGLTVRGQADIGLYGMDAKFSGCGECNNRILGRQRLGASVSDSL